MTANRDRAMDEIELEAARTRARLANTADALAAELAPPLLVKKGVDMLNGFLGRGFLDRSFLGRSGAIGFGGRLRADPVVLALVGLGAAWLVAENAGLLDRLIPDRANKAAPSAEPIVALPAERPVEPSGGGNGWFHHAASATHGAQGLVCDRGGAVIEQAGEFIARPADSGERVPQAGGRMFANIGRSPLLLGLAGLAAGGVVAMLLPTSRRERAIAAQARDDLWDKAEELGHRAANSMREMAESSLHASTDR
jgi:Protein of unknown function (DUF3618)